MLLPASDAESVDMLVLVRPAKRSLSNVYPSHATVVAHQDVPVTDAEAMRRNFAMHSPETTN